MQVAITGKLCARCRTMSPEKEKYRVHSCYWCGSAFTGLTCTICGTAYDKEKETEYYERQSLSYRDRFYASVTKAGRNARAAWQVVLRKRQHAFEKAAVGYVAAGKKIDAFLQRRGVKKKRFLFVRRKEEERE